MCVRPSDKNIYGSKTKAHVLLALYAAMNRKYLQTLCSSLSHPLAIFCWPTVSPGHLHDVPSKAPKHCTLRCSMKGKAPAKLRKMNLAFLEGDLEDEDDHKCSSPPVFTVSA